MRAKFVPRPETAERPRWSVMIPAYNSAAFLRRTLASVLAQDQGPGRMQIEVVDDASSDDPRSIVDEVGGGRIGFFAQPANRGQIGNLNCCIERARGEIVHLLHGDDYVLPGYYAALDRAFERSEVGAAFCRWMIVDESDRTLTVSEPEQEHAGLLKDALAHLAAEQRIVTPSIAIRRRVWEQLDGFDSRLRCAEDWEMWVRIAAHHAIWYEPELLAAYRRHDGSTTARGSRNAEELYYSGLAITLFAPLLPPERARDIVRSARRAYAKTAIANARGYRRRRDWSAARANAAAALRLDPSRGSLAELARAFLKRREGA
ncbi:glycosyltransferase [Sphingomonas sp. URHD0057]|uniref:glycosyltransferase n=1 Tax=Sphingomonas sp. URHD0057 TaxID=1380389 RepID=UPI0006878B67|nr:glycosyltransferase [Sphingomonas sp. URHD0057]